MTIESLGRKNGPKPGEHGVAGARHGRRPQPETRPVPTARPKPAPPQGQARQPAQPGQPGQPAQPGQPGPVAQAGRPGPAAQAGRPGRTPEADSTKTATEPQGTRERGQGPGGTGPGQGPMQRRGRGDGKSDAPNRGGDRSLYDGGSPSANRLGPAKAMRARDVSRPRD